MTPVVLLTWTFYMLLTFTNGNQAKQEYHGFQTEELCNRKLAERRVWLENQQREGLIKGSATVVCHEEPS